MSHTKGPWLYRGKSESVHKACDTHPYGRQIFRFVEDEAPSDDDLALMLAAPELIEALMGYVGWIESGRRDVDLYDRAKAAIAKARSHE